MKSEAEVRANLAYWYKQSEEAKSNLNRNLCHLIMEILEEILGD